MDESGLPVPEQKEGAQTIREGYFRDLVENTSDWLWEVDERFRYVYVSPKVLELLGYAPQEILGRTPWDFMLPEEAESLKRLMEQLIQSPGPFQGRVRLSLHKNGSARLTESNGVPVFDAAGKLTGFRGVDRDLTGLQRGEEARRRSEEQLRSLVEHAPYGISRSSITNDRFLSANPALVKMLGYDSEAEVLALQVSADVYCDADDRAQFLAQTREGERFHGIELRWKRRDGKPITVRTSGIRKRDTEGAGEVLEAITEDVTQQRVLEQQVRQSQKMDAVGQLAGGVAHDFNNLLGVILACSELLERDLGEGSPLLRRVKAIQDAGQRAASLTAQLLAFGRRQMMQPQLLSLNVVVADAEKMLRSLIGEHIELALALDPTLGQVKADPGRIEQVIVNLVVNAREAMAEGGTLSLRTTDVRLEEGSHYQGVSMQSGRYALLAITDTGSGMDAQILAHLFEPFFTTKGVGQGTGLGLATVYGIVKQSGGYIFAESELGKGTTFKIYLPCVADTRAIAPGVAAKAVRAWETILLVEDATTLREIIRESLVGDGYQVLAAANGVDALQVAELHPGTIHLLLTDLVMPKMSGSELAQRMTAIRPEIAVLYMSGHADDTLARVRGLDPTTALIKKPFVLGDLAQRVRELLQTRR